jgi:transposase
MTTVATRRQKGNTGEHRPQRAEISKGLLHLAFELDDQAWKLGFTTGLGQRSGKRRIGPRDREAILESIAEAKERFRLQPETRVVSCYEAGREGFWLHRFLWAHGVENRVVDSSSIEVNRRARRAKADRLDLDKLLRMLVRHEAGEKKMWSVVRVPTPEEEDARHLHREVGGLKGDRTRAANRIHGLLATQGVRLALGADLPVKLGHVRLWDGSPLLPGLRRRVLGAWQQWLWLDEQIRDLEKERRELLRTSEAAAVEQVRRLLRLKGIGETSAWVFVMEFYAWRDFQNRRQVGALAGFTPTPYQSGSTDREQGISKAGNRHIRSVAVQIAWCWLRYQPESALSRWYEERFGGGSKRVRKIGIVALARRLLIELWRYLQTGAIPEGAVVEA